MGWNNIKQVSWSHTSQTSITLRKESNKLTGSFTIRQWDHKQSSQRVIKTQTQVFEHETYGFSEERKELYSEANGWDIQQKYCSSGNSLNISYLPLPSWISIRRMI